MVSVSKKPAWIALGGALIFHTVMLSLQTNPRNETGFMRQWLLDGLAPIEKIVDSGVRGVSAIWDGYIGLIGIQKENEDLRAEIDALKMRLQQQEESIKEAERLRAFLDLPEPSIGKTVTARVIGRDPSRSLQTVTIDKGQSSGIREDDSVITPDGVVGRVISTGRYSAVVQLITDAQSVVAVLLKESRIQALFKGTGGRDLELDYIDTDRDIAVGDELLTSGQDQIHPKGLPLATVTAVGPEGELFRAVLARPVVDLGRLEDVLVIIEPAEPVEPQQAPSAPLPGD